MNVATCRTDWLRFSDRDPAVVRAFARGLSHSIPVCVTDRRGRTERYVNGQPTLQALDFDAPGAADGHGREAR